MTMRTKILIISVLLIFVSCRSEYQKLLKSNDFNAKYEAAVRYYNNEDYYKAQNLFEAVASVYRGTERAEDINYYLSYCYYHRGEYIMSGFYFDNFASTFSSSDKAAEAQFMAGESFKNESPKPSLDQEYTLKSIEAYQMYLNRFAGGQYEQNANDEISKLRKKLETKSYENARLYHKLGDYKAAVIALKECLREFPDTDYNEDLSFLILESSYKLASNSVEKRKYERYEAAVDEYYSYIDQYPAGKYAKEAEKIFESSMKFLKRTTGTDL
jgi:outer membrane protein assembly factor BamD